MAETDPEQREPTEQLGRGGDPVRRRRRIAGSVRQEHAVEAAGDDVAAGVSAGKTVASSPAAASMRRMFRLIPKS